jgi:exodeoxyribonuclease V alpha subunit
MNTRADATLTGTLTKWTQVNPSGWGHGIITTASASVRVAGTISGARAGDSIECTGYHEHHPRFGEQFAIKRATVTVPQSQDAVVSWLSATWPNIGATRARALLDHFGGPDGLWHAVEHTPERLAEVRGITLERTQEIRTAYLGVRDGREHEIELRQWLSESQIGRCKMVFGQRAADVVAVIKQDPYVLYLRVEGIGWPTADVIALKSGIPRDAPMRIASALTYALEQHTAEHGHVYMRPGPYREAAMSLLGLDTHPVMREIDRALGAGRIVRRGGRIYTAGMERLECELAELISERKVVAYEAGSDRIADDGAAVDPDTLDLPWDRAVGTNSTQ